MSLNKVAGVQAGPWQAQLAEDGFAIFRHEFSSARVEQILSDLTLAIDRREQLPGSVRSRRGDVYAARNLIDWFPDCRSCWQTDSLVQKLQTVLGTEFGLVRALYFDKHPGRPWSLPWHKDRTIAVKKNDLPSVLFRNPTRKAGVPHVEAPETLLEEMLTLRIHLDRAGEANGALKVISGSHLDHQVPQNQTPIVELIAAEPGDVLAMRPLISHASGNPVPDGSHRRIIHLEFAPSRQLADGYQWNEFHPAISRSSCDVECKQ